MIDLGKNFSALHTFECGQCFRWNSLDDGSYIGISQGKVCRVDKNMLICPNEDNEFWENYLTQDIDYDKINRDLVKSDPLLKKCILYGSGLRILRQDPWETILSFIISANNNIPRIKGIIEMLCRMFGDKTEYENTVYYSFPSAETISGLDIADLAPLKAGYRDKYILDAAQKVSSGELDLSRIGALNTDDLKRELMKIKGVGSKVADCVLLFAYSRWEQFPKDVWIKRILKDVYNVCDSDMDVFVKKNYGGYAGFAQQYLYYYYRDNDIDVN